MHVAGNFASLPSQQNNGNILSCCLACDITSSMPYDAQMERLTCWDLFCLPQHVPNIDQQEYRTLFCEKQRGMVLLVPQGGIVRQRNGHSHFFLFLELSKVFNTN